MHISSTCAEALSDRRKFTSFIRLHTSLYDSGSQLYENNQRNLLALPHGRAQSQENNNHFSELQWILMSLAVILFSDLGFLWKRRVRM